MSLGALLSTGRKIVAVGRNFAAHAAELKNAIPTTPVLFLKPTTSYLQWRAGPIVIPKGLTELHHEVELGVVIGTGGSNIPKSMARKHIAGYVLALDMTARDVQEKAKKAGLPWSVSKGYDTFCPVSPFIPEAKIPDPQNVQLWLKVNGALKQQGTTAHMLFPIDTLIEHISSIFTLQAGDLILTGTPEGVGPVRAGDRITAGLTGIVEMDFDVAAAPASPPYVTHKAKLWGTFQNKAELKPNSRILLA